MTRVGILLFLALLAVILTKRINHEQAFDSFKCCPNGYELDLHTMQCVCHFDKPHQDLGGNCVTCDAFKHSNE